MNRMTYRGGSGGGMTIPGGPIGKARMALAYGQTDEAIRICRKRLERQPDDHTARLLLAQALLQDREIEEAAKEARRVTREQPNNADAHLTLAAALMQQGRIRIPAEAETEARRAVQLQPKLARARVQLAEVLVANDNLAGAREEAENAIKLEPRSPSGYFIKAFVLLREKDYEGTVQACDSALRFDKEHNLAQAETLKARALIELKRYDEALASIDAAEKQNPLLGGANAHSLRGTIYFKQWKIRDSYQEFLTAQRESGRTQRWFAPIGAVISMIYSPFGERAQYWLLATVLLIVALILFGVSFIPVAGTWIDAALIIALVGVMSFAALRFGTGRILPENRGEWLITIGAMIAGGILGGAIVAGIEYLIASFTTRHPPIVQLNPTNIGLLGSAALAAAAATGYGWPLLIDKLNRRSPQAASAR